jgi:hypothetical protein
MFDEKMKGKTLSGNPVIEPPRECPSGVAADIPD